MKTLIFTVTNDLNYDQRMQRICTSLAKNGFNVLLVGRKSNHSMVLQKQDFKQKRLNCFFQRSMFFYMEFNFRLFFFLLFQKFDAVCAIDLDTIIPCYAAAALRKKKRVYDAHELFTEQKEIVTRKWVHAFWLWVEKHFVPKFSDGYTVNRFIAQEFGKRYKVNYQVIRNLPVQYELTNQPKEEIYILYQGAVNEGRCFETLLPAMKAVNAKLVICGTGNFFKQLQTLISIYGLEDQVILKGKLLPDDLKQITLSATIAVTLFEPTGLNQIHSLCNRFFDYIMAVVPQVCVGFPEYRTINNEHEVALLINEVDKNTIATAINKLLSDKILQQKLRSNCIKAREILNWNAEEKKIVDFWNEKMKTCSDT